jgi:glycosyltransferase involved in cell wall biosynthesis
MKDFRKIVYLGFNSMYTHKRGVENVIHFQSLASPFKINYYLHWDKQTRVRRYQNLICVGVKKNVFWFLTLNFILSKLKNRDKLFIHSHNPLMSIVSIYRSNLFTVHDALYYLTQASKYKFQFFFWILEKMLYLRCNYVHFISDYTKKMSLFTNSKNFVITPNTSHLESLKIDKFNNNDNLVKYTEGFTKVFTVRSIEKRALINLIIEVADKLKTEKIEFFIAGKGPLLNFYRDQIKRLGIKNITLLGYISDFELIHYYHQCDLVLIPADFGEGFGLPIIEAYLFDKPVISSNVCAIPDIIISNDFLFNNTTESIISKIFFAKNQNQFQFKSYYDDVFSNKVVYFQIKQLYLKLACK